jgi:hypothetical protein
VLRDGCGHLPGQYDAEQQARAPDAGDQRVVQALDAAADLLPHALDVVEQALVRDGPDDGEGGRAADRVAAERGAVRAGPEQVPGVAEREARADRQAAAETLGQGHDVGLDAIGLVREPVAGPADAGLHLVQHEQGGVRGADLPGRREVSGWRGHHAGLALDRLEDHHGGRVGHGDAEGVGVAVPDMGDVWRQRPERVHLGRLAGQGQRTHRAAVEAALGGDDVAAAGEPGQLEGGLVGLGAGVAEQYAARTSGQCQQQLGEGDGRLGDVEVGDVAERGDLLGDGGDHGRVGVAEGVDGDATEQVHVPLTLLVGEHDTLTLDQRQGRGAVVVHHGLRPAFDE